VLATHSPDWQIALFIIVVGFTIIMVNNILVYIFNRGLFKLLVVIPQRMRTRLSDRLLALSREFYDASQAGRLLTTAVGDPSSITHMLTAGMINAIANALIVLGGYFILFKMHPMMTAAISAVFPVMIASFFVLRPAMYRVNEEIRENWGIICGMVAEKVSGVRVVRSFAAEEVEAKKFGDRVYYHRDLHVNYSLYSASYGFLNGISVHLGYLIVFVFGGWLYIKGEATIGTVVAFYGYFQSLWPAILQICNMPQQVAMASGSLNKVFGLLDQPLRIVNRAGAGQFEDKVDEIVFENVSFRYGEHLPWALSKVNLKLAAGQQIGIVGPSGSGKSTLMALMLRYYDVTEGRILLNGRDIREWDLMSLRRAFGLVPQDMILFSGTIRDNVVYTHGEMDDARVWKSLEEAEAAEFVRSTEKGLDTLVGEEGLSLSGGQKQRLSIARAILPEPQVLILDNCTSALDAATEQRIQATLRAKLKDRTAFIISHRIASVTPCSTVIVMDGGRIIEEGSPLELLGTPGYFANIYKQQAEAPA
jgi:subfamily B ATP-binding cassette protein MsbA